MVLIIKKTQLTTRLSGDGAKKINLDLNPNVVGTKGRIWAGKCIVVIKCTCLCLSFTCQWTGGPQSTRYLIVMIRNAINGTFKQILFYIERVKYFYNENMLISPHVPHENSSHFDLFTILY